MFKSLKKLIKNLLIHTQNIPDFVAFAFYFKRGVNLYLYSFIKNRVIAMSQLRNCIISQLFNSFILFHSMGCGLLSPLVPRGGNWAVLLLAHGHAQAPPGGNPPPGQVLLNTALCWCPPPLLHGIRAQASTLRLSTFSQRGSRTVPCRGRCATVTPRSWAGQMWVEPASHTSSLISNHAT